MQNFSAAEPSSNTKSTHARLMRLMDHKNGLLRTFSYSHNNSVQERVSCLRDLLEILNSTPRADLQDILKQYTLDFEGNNLVQIWIKSIQDLPIPYDDKEDHAQTTSGRIQLIVTESYDAAFIEYTEQCLRRFIEIHPDFLKHQNHAGKTVLHTACQYGDIFLARAIALHKSQDNFITWLINKRASLETVDIDYNTLLHDAAAFGCAETVQLLLDKDLRADRANLYKLLPVHFAWLGRLKNHRFSDYTKTVNRLLSADSLQKRFDTSPYDYKFNEKIQLFQYKQCHGTWFSLKNKRIVKISHYFLSLGYRSQEEYQENLRHKSLKEYNKSLFDKPVTSSSKIFELLYSENEEDDVDVFNWTHDISTGIPILFNEPMQAMGFWVEAPIPSIFYRYKLCRVRGCTPAVAFFELFHHYPSCVILLLDNLPRLMKQSLDVLAAVAVDTCSRNPEGHTALTLIIQQLQFTSTIPIHHNQYYKTANSDQSMSKPEERIKRLNALLHSARNCMESLLHRNPELVHARYESDGEFYTPLHYVAILMKHLRNMGYALKDIEVNLFEFLIAKGAKEDLNVKDHAGLIPLNYYPDKWLVDPRIPKKMQEWTKLSEGNITNNLLYLIGNPARKIIFRK